MNQKRCTYGAHLILEQIASSRIVGQVVEVCVEALVDRSGLPVSLGDILIATFGWMPSALPSIEAPVKDLDVVMTVHLG